MTASLDAAVRLGLGSFELDADLTVASGEVVALLGPNGAGKTTLLRALAGLVPLDGGHVRLGGRVLDDRAGGVHVPTAERPIGYVFQDYLLFPHLSALDNVAFGLRCRGRSRAEARRVASAWLDRVDLADHARARPATLSGGQAQRVALARSLATEPGLLLLDEPLAALDAATRAEVRSDLRRHLATFDGARLLVTHDPTDAMVLASRLVIIEEGRVVQTGTPGEVSRHPRSSYVARLVGVNLLSGRARGPVVDLDGAGELRTASSAVVSDGERVLATIRPQSVALYRQRPDGTPRNVWPGRINNIDLEGDRVRAHVDGPVPLVAEVTAAAVADLALHDGSDVWVSVKATDIDVYPG